MNKKFKVSVKHINRYTDDDSYEVIYERTVGIYDSLDSAVNKLIDIGRSEGLSEREERETREFIFNGYTAGANLVYNDISRVIHDYPAFYVGPGIVSIETTVLQ